MRDYSHPLSLQIEVSNISASVALEQIPPMHVLVLVVVPSPQVALQLVYSVHSEYTKSLKRKNDPGIMITWSFFDADNALVVQFSVDDSEFRICMRIRFVGLQ